MKTNLLACLLIFAALNFAFVLPNSTNLSKKDFIEWQSDKPLSWSDFKARAKNNTNISALTASAIEYAYECKRGELDISVRAIFIPTESWAKTDAKTNYILAHEQLHFDITEIYSRKLRQELSKKVTKCSDMRKIEGIAEGVIREWKKEQAAYDKDSKHSMDKTLQNIWDEKIATDLKASGSFSLKTLN